MASGQTGFQGVVGTVSGTSISFGSVTEIDGSGSATVSSGVF